MAAPNIANPTTIAGKSGTLALTTSAQTLLNNAASSGKCLRVMTIFFANIDGSAAADVTLSYYPQDDVGGTAVKILNTVSVPADSTLRVDGPIYLEEDRSLGALASANGDIEATIFYEDIS